MNVQIKCAGLYINMHSNKIYGINVACSVEGCTISLLHRCIFLAVIIYQRWVSGYKVALHHSFVWGQKAVSKEIKIKKQKQMHYLSK